MSPAHVRLGIAGWGAAGRLMADAVGRSDRVRLVAVAEPDPKRRAEAASAVPNVVPSVEALADRYDLDAVYLATPTPLHAEHIITVVDGGKHVIVEKPLAATVATAEASIERAEQRGVVLMVGSSHGYDSPVRVLAELVASMRLGPLEAVSTWCYTDWLQRPRSAADLDATVGGGVVFRQGAHQVDILRTIAQADVRTVRAATFGGASGTEIGYAALLGFANGVTGSAVYSGLGGFDTRLLTFGTGELGEQLELRAGAPRRSFLHDPMPARKRPPQFGFTVATFADGEVVPSRDGMLVLGRDVMEEVPVDAYPSGWDAVLLELLSALEGKTPFHDGRWGLSTLRVCSAVHESALSGGAVAT